MYKNQYITRLSLSLSSILTIRRIYALTLINTSIEESVFGNSMPLFSSFILIFYCQDVREKNGEKAVDSQ